MWITKLSGINDEVGYTVRQTSDGGYVICGYISSCDTSTKHVYLMRLAPERYVAENGKQFAEERNLELAIVRGPLLIHGINNCDLFDISGRKVEVDNMIPGVYYVLEQGKVVQKIIMMG